MLRPMRRRSAAPFALALVALAGCGSSSSGSGSGTATKAPSAPKQVQHNATVAPVGKPIPFPSARGKTLTSLRAALPKGPILAPSTSASLATGSNRFGFALFTASQEQVAGARVAIYTTDHDGSNVRGPFVARSESLAVAPPFQSQTTASDPAAAQSVYVASVPIPKAGKRVITGVAQVGNKLYATSGIELDVPRRGTRKGPPDVGQAVPRIHTPTLASAGGDAKKIDTRVPTANGLLRDDLYDVLGKKPVVLAFATPLLCQSRVCGPVVDIVDQVHAQLGAKASFIHVEIYKDNKVADGFLPQVEAFRLPTEPWVFVIDRHGRVSTRFEGAFSAGELAAAVKRVA
jgi:hypothetical protein